MLLKMRDFIQLRNALACRDIDKIQSVLLRVSHPDYKRDEDTIAMFKDEITLAQAMMKLISIQNAFAEELDDAIEMNDLLLLNK